MYSFSITEQFIVFLESFGFGFMEGLCYSAVNFIVGLFVFSKKKIIITDAVFSVLNCFLLFCFILTFNLGKVRFHLILGILLGVLVYFLSVEELLLKISNGVSSAMRRFFIIVFFPIKKLTDLINKIFKKISYKFMKPIAKEDEDIV